MEIELLAWDDVRHAVDLVAELRKMIAATTTTDPTLDGDGQ